MNRDEPFSVEIGRVVDERPLPLSVIAQSGTYTAKDPKGFRPLILQVPERKTLRV